MVEVNIYHKLIQMHHRRVFHFQGKAIIGNADNGVFEYQMK